MKTLVAGQVLVYNTAPARDGGRDADAAAPPMSVMNSRRFTARCPLLRTERIAHLGTAGGFALRDFNLGYGRSGSIAS
jgi:hypothetical protein